MNELIHPRRSTFFILVTSILHFRGYRIASGGSAVAQVPRVFASIRPSVSPPDRSVSNNRERRVNGARFHRWKAVVRGLPPNRLVCHFQGRHVNDISKSNFALFHLVVSVVHVLDVDQLDIGTDAMLCAKIQHLLRIGKVADQ